METITLSTILSAVKMLDERVISLEKQLNERYFKETEHESEEALLNDIGTITKPEVAKLLKISERSVIRYRKRYSFPIKRVGREKHYYLVPIIRAIQKHKLPWCEKTYAKIRQTKKLIPKI